LGPLPNPPGAGKQDRTHGKHVAKSRDRFSTSGGCTVLVTADNQRRLYRITEFIAEASNELAHVVRKGFAAQHVGM
jgi:hypothetical protein